ncbi:MAG: hypothetical protein HPY74_11835 [Firmicutes bacterium]|nr:hypothetical protein [Bacillota bacterium]
MKEKKPKIGEFSAVTTFVKGLIDNNRIKIFIPTEDIIKLIVTDKDEIKRFCEKEKIKEKYAYYLIDIEIPRLISHILNELPDTISFNGRPLEEDEKEDFSAKLKIVKDILIDTKIKNTHLIKSTSKVKSITSIDWEVSKKLFADTEGNLPELLYATLNLNISKPNSQSNPIAKLFSLNEAEETVCINCDLSDIDYFIDIFSDIKKALESEGDKS